MGKLDSNQSIGMPRGKIGGLIYAKFPDGRVIVRKRPASPGQCTASRKANQSRFRLAVAYFSAVRAQPAQLAAYQTAARIRRKRACDLALADFLHPPVLVDVDLAAYTGQPGETIRIRATDDFEVVAVLVSIRTLQAELIEEGQSVLEPGEAPVWNYVTQAAVPLGQSVIVDVAALDRPGNKVQKAFDHACGPRLK